MRASLSGPVPIRGARRSRTLTIAVLIVSTSLLFTGPTMATGTTPVDFEVHLLVQSTNPTPWNNGHAVVSFSVATLPVGTNYVIVQFFPDPSSTYANAATEQPFTVSPARTILDFVSSSPVEVGISTDVGAFVHRYDDGQFIPGLVLVFTIDASIVPAGVTAATLQLFRNGVLVADCPGATQAIPDDPCVSNRATLVSPDAGDIRLTALTSQASEWSAGYVPFVWSDFRAPVDPFPTFNKAKAGTAIPVRFNIGGDHGLVIFASGYPGSNSVACSSGALVDLVEETVAAGSSSLSYDKGTGVYTYIWKTDKSWAGSCRQLVLAFNSNLGTQRANFQFTR